jgi:hypothetical protein
MVNTFTKCNQLKIFTSRKKDTKRKMSDQIIEITKQEMQELKMNDRQFAEYLTEAMSNEGDSTLSHATVINWRKHGKPPATDFLEDMISVYPSGDRRFRFALRMLAVKSPHVWGAGGAVWSLKKDLLPKID